MTVREEARNGSADPLMGAIRQFEADLKEAVDARARIERELEVHLSPKAKGLYRAAMDAYSELHGAENDLHGAELARHLPGLAPTIRLLWAHVIDARLDRVGSCCIDGGPVEP